MTIIYINGNKYNVDESKNLLQTCLSLDIDIPYFCWHPALGSVGSCRLCAVKQYDNLNDDSGRMIMSCISPVLENMRISTIDLNVKKFRKGIIELLMTNHPHDCPICEEGGNCHLQDMTVMTKHYNRRYIYTKRTHRNQYLGSFISHQMNRCIGCYRCVRYYKDYAGGTDFGVYGMSNNIYFGRFKDGSLENEHSGNLIEICPTGVFTDKIYSKNYNRKWDLQYSPSICQHCSIGCNISVGERYGKINKIENRYHHNINRYFLCDLGRFGYGYTYLKNRPKNPIKYIGKDKEELLNEFQAIQLISDIFKKSNKVIGIGSVRSSIENNFALRKLVGKNNFYNGMSNIDHICVNLIIDILKNSNIYIPTLREVEGYDTILVIGEDLTQTSPRMALAVRRASKKNSINKEFFKDIPKWHSSAILNISDSNKKCVYIIHTHESKLDDISKLNYFASINDQEIFLSYISNNINNLSNHTESLKISINEKINIITNALLSSKKPLIISGSHSGSENLIKISVNIAKGLQFLKKDVGLVLLTPSVNSIGVNMMSSMNIEDALDKCIKQKIDTLIVLENDLYRHSMKDRINMALNNVQHIIVLDHKINNTVKKSTLFFPISNFSEGSGTVINYESRAQRFFATFNPIFYDNKSYILEGWKWLYKIYFNIYHIKNEKIYLDNVIKEYILDIKIFDKIKYLTPNSNFRIIGQKIARLPHRASGRTAINSHINVHEKNSQKDNNTMFSFSMEGNQNSMNNSEYIPFYWAPGWNSIQSFNKYEKKKKYFNSGIRLFKSNNIYSKYFFQKLSISSSRKKDWNIVPYYLLFGSEEMSYDSYEIKKKCSNLYALVNIIYKSKLLLRKNSIIEFNVLGKIFKFLIKFSIHLPLKKIGLPIGLPGLPRSLIGQIVHNVRGIM